MTTCPGAGTARSVKSQQPSRRAVGFVSGKVEDLNRELKDMRALVEELHSALRAAQTEKSSLQVRALLHKCVSVCVLEATHIIKAHTFVPEQAHRSEPTVSVSQMMGVLSHSTYP